MDDRLAHEVWQRVGDAQDLDDTAGYLLLAALEGDDALRHELGGDNPARAAPAEPVSAPDPARAYLGRVQVTGFRGIGPPQELELNPGPGLTLVVGRNGSGKSSFAEGLEMALTGTSSRWAGKRSKEWEGGWRNLHAQQPSSVEVQLTVEGQAAPTVVRRSWPAGGQLSDGSTRVQVPGEPEADLHTLGWADALRTYRPFLSYDELGSLLEEGPSRLHDAMSAILGLEDLDAAVARLGAARRQREDLAKVTRQRTAGLLRRLQGMDDERARRCAVALSHKAPDLAAVEATLVDGAGEQDAELAALRSLASLQAPDPVVAQRAAADLREAAERRRNLSGTDGETARRLADLLDDALAVHAAHGDGDCPVCGQPAVMNARWRSDVTSEVGRLRAAARAVDEADRGLQDRIRAVEQLLRPLPAALADATTVGLDPQPADLWRHWLEGAQRARASGWDALADHLDATTAELQAQLDKLRRAAVEELAHRQDVWRPVAGELGAWLQDAIRVQAESESVRQLKTAEQWGKQLGAQMRAERFAPIAAECKRVWSQLRTASNVDVHDVVLAGTATKRRVAMEVTVDGLECPALGVMSQGELHALALSLFLPRATLAASPLRFVVIDDPVQSMDPARVDGLARVLADTAKTRQVVVFSHDDRLPEAVRRLQIDATVLGVVRRGQSVVEVRTELDPVARAIDDARALALTAELPEAVARRVVPGFCRIALEAACVEAIRRRRLGRGDRAEDVEKALDRADKLTKKTALALFDDEQRGADVLARLGAFGGGRARDVYQRCNRGAHEPITGSLATFVDDAAELARNLRRQT